MKIPQDGGEKPLSPNKVAIAVVGGIDCLIVSEIVYCKACGSYVEFHMTSEPQIVTVARTLEECLENLSAHDFVQTHRSFAINPEHVKSFLTEDGGKLAVTGPDEVPVSDSFRDYILARIKQMLIRRKSA